METSDAKQSGKRGSLQNVREAIAAIGIRLAGSGIKWLIGGSGSLLVHGLEVAPNDIDLVVDPQDKAAAQRLLTDILTGEAKTHFRLNGVAGDIITHHIDPEKIMVEEIDGVKINVRSLEYEYEYYRNRTDKQEENKKKIALIETALGLG